MSQDNPVSEKRLGVLVILDFRIAVGMSILAALKGNRAMITIKSLPVKSSLVVIIRSVKCTAFIICCL